MHYQTFGRRSGLRISEYALGTGHFGTSELSAGAEASRAMFHAYVAAGGTTFDTSNVYQGGEAEAMLGTLMGSDRDDFVIVTKYSGTVEKQPSPGTTGNSRKTMVRSLEASLTRLQTDYVDVYMPHIPDGVTPTDEILAALDDLVRSGKVLYGGLSNFPAWRIAGAATRAQLGGMAPVTSIQTEYSLAERSADRELLPMAQAYGLGVLLYSPLAGGLLTGKYRRGETGRLSARGDAVESSAQQTAVVDSVLAVASELHSSAGAVALAWLRRRASSAPTALIPIIGPRSLAHLDEYLRSLDLILDDEQYRRLDDVSVIQRLGSPHDVVAAGIASGYDGDRTTLKDIPIGVI